MSAPGIPMFSEPGVSNAPSPSIWADSPNTLLEDKGMGYFAHEEFLAPPTGTTGATAGTLLQTEANFGGKLKLDADDAIVVSLKTDVGGVVKGITPATDNTAFALFGSPLGTITLKSGQKFWFEACFELNELTDAGVFIGLTTAANANKTAVANNPTNAGPAGLTAATVVGFRSNQVASAIAQFDAVYSKAAGTPVVVLTNVTQAGAIPTANQVAVAATTKIKLGIRFNGRDKLYFYANGFKVATQTVDTTVDQTSNLVPIVNYKVGTAAAKGMAVDWIRFAFQRNT